MIKDGTPTASPYKTSAAATTSNNVHTIPLSKEPYMTAFDLNKIQHVIKENDVKPSIDDRHHIFFTALADKHKNTVYLDLTGQFPFDSLDGNMCVLVLYDY